MKVCNIAEDGLPTVDDEGFVAFIYQGCVISGFCLFGEDGPDGKFTENDWQGDGIVTDSSKRFSGVKHYIIFDTDLGHIL